MHLYKTMENGVQIVEFEESLAAQVAAMWNKSNDSWGGGNYVMTPATAIANYLNGSNFNVFIALDNGEAVGLCTFMRYYNDENTTYVGLLNVRPDYHGKKVGKELVLACVNKTIEMGFPRVDINTWAGNTKAVPLYKKCGFLWEDNSNTTHLSNYIPTVLNTELFSDYFKTADWYADMSSTKVIEIKPDGVKVDKFEFYGYSWEKDGNNLSVGFEKTGRRIRFVETDDYKIEFTAKNHELAFGLNYDCKFNIVNKSGKELNVKIVGKNDDKGIKFDFSADTKIETSLEMNTQFYVEPIKKDQNTGKMHPCVLADVYINGKHVEFGLGIEPKYPLIVNVLEKRHGVTRSGISQNVYINVKSALPQTAAVKFTLPETTLTKFSETEFSIDKITSGETVMMSLREEILKCGYEKLDVAYEITFEDGSSVNFTKPHHLINQSVDEAFSFELENEYSAVNGVWKLTAYKNSDNIGIFPCAGYGYMRFRAPQLGKPYNDEFNRMDIADTRFYKRDNLMVAEFDYESKAFAGAILTQIFEFSAAGIASRHLKVTNKSENTIPELFLQEQAYSNVGRRCIFHYDGEYHEVNDDTVYALSEMDPEKIDENWLFDNSPNIKCGMYWDKDYTAKIKWGDEILIEHEIGELAPNAVFETKPFCYMNGIFNNVREFRNYVVGVDETIAPYTRLPLEIAVNERNPFITTDTDTIEAAIINNRTKIYDGDIIVTSPDGLFDKAVQTNPVDTVVERNTFNLDIGKKIPGIHLIDIDYKHKYEKSNKRILFVADKSSAVKTDETDGIYTVDNGILTYKVAPDHYDAVYSLKYGENEWLFSKYPALEPYAWWNPFIGGIQINLWNMNSSYMRREKRSAEFVTVKDSKGTEWTGIKTTVAIKEFAEHKGFAYEQYFVTQPSLPVLCHFVRFINNTGGYKSMGYDVNMYTSNGENLGDIFGFATNSERESYRVKMGDIWLGGDKLVKMSFEGKIARNEKLFVYMDAGRNNGSISINSDINQCNVFFSGSAHNMLNNTAWVSRPAFIMLTENEITLDSVTDLERVLFGI